MAELLGKPLYYIGIYGRPILAAVTLIFGILIICKSDRITKLLGIFFTANAVGTIVNSIAGAILQNPDSNISSFANELLNLISITISGVVVVSLFFYAKFSYNTKIYLLFIMTGIIVGGAVLMGLLTPVISSFFVKEAFVKVTYITSVLSVLNSSVVTVMFLIIYFKNRNKEDKLKLFWVYHLIAVIFVFYNIAINLTGAIFVSSAFQDDLRTMLQLLVLIGSDLGMFSLPVFSIYVFVKSRRPSLEIV